MKKTIILNHKMNLDYDMVYPYIESINNVDTDMSLIVCPSNIYLENFINNCSWGVGAQDVFYEESGNYTGEVSTIQLKSLGVEYSIIGHDERRKITKETVDIINKKLIACLESNIQPILCFGSTGNISDIEEELDGLLKDVNNINFIIFAYEPMDVKDIQSLDDINDNINSIYDYLYEKYQVKPFIIYGGGVNKDNVKEILDISLIDGVIIGSMSSDFKKIKEVIDVCGENEEEVN